MTIKVQKKPKESTGELLKRFSSVVLRSGIINEYKKRLYRFKPKSRNLKRKHKLEALRKKERMEYLRKIGVIK